MNEFNRKVSDLVEKLWIDHSVTENFVRAPRSILQEYSIVIPEPVFITVLVDTPDLANFVLPKQELSTESQDVFLRKNLVWFCRGSIFSSDSAKYYSPIRISYQVVRSVFDQVMHNGASSIDTGIDRVSKIVNDVGIASLANVNAVNVRQNSETHVFLVVPLPPPGATASASGLRKAARANDWVTHASFLSYFCLSSKEPTARLL